jgi:hypothetical protein
MELINKLHTRTRFERLHSLRRHGDQLPNLYPILRSINPLAKMIGKNSFYQINSRNRSLPWITFPVFISMYR